MELPEDVLNGLRDLLRESTARITQSDGSLPAGAAFFVSDTLLITNRHVVGPWVDGMPQAVRVHPYGAAEYVEGEVLPPSATEPELDIALVRVPPQANPAMVLHPGLDGWKYLLAGYPREDFYTEIGPGVEVTSPIEGRVRMNASTAQPDLLRLTDVQIKPGFSGGPVLDISTGAVVAVAVFTEDQDAALGGGSVPVRSALAAYPELKQIAADPPNATRRAKTMLDRAGWERLGLVWSRDEQVDIHLSGDRSRWRIELQPDSAERTIRDLGDEMGEVLASWARAAGRRGESEVRVLGRLLSGAMFPPDPRLPPPADHDSDPVLVRLHVDPNGPLADLPWEIATVPTDPHSFLAGADGYAFVRVNPDAPVGRNRIVARNDGEQVRVLAVIVQPENTSTWLPVVDTRAPIPWPSSGKIGDDLAKRIEGPTDRSGATRFSLERLVNPTLSKLEKQAAATGGVDIVHYIGFGYQEPEGSGELGWNRVGIACAAGTDDAYLRYHPAKEVLDVLSKFDPGLVIFEFGTPSIDDPYDGHGKGCQPIGPAFLGAASEFGLDAMVCSRPVHPRQFDQFNDELYSSIAAGKTIEQSVQLARVALCRDHPIDWAGFAWFSATTGNQPRARFFRPPNRGTPSALGVGSATIAGSPNRGASAPEGRSP